MYRLVIIALFVLGLTASVYAQPVVSGRGRITSLGQISGSICADGEVLLNVDATSWACGSAGIGGSTLILDLADDDANESAGVTEVATTGDTNSIFTEPTANKLLVDVSNAWPTADALAANGTNCSAGQAAGGVDTSGNAEDCIAPLTIDAVNTEAALESTSGVDLIISTEIDTIAEVEARAAGVDIVTSNEIGSVAALEGYAASENIITATEIDTIGELETLVGENIIIDGELVNLNAVTATALAADPTDCAGGQFATGIAADGDLTCATPAGAGDLSAVDIDTEAEFEAIVGVDYAKTTGDNVATASALAANGANCSVGNSPLGIDANGAVESCFDVLLPTELDSEAELESVTGIANVLVGTELDSEAELESVTGITNILIETEIDSEAKLEAIVGANFAKTTGDNVATATALATDPTDCSAGQAAQGIDANGNAVGCFTPAGGGGATGTLDQSFDLGKIIDGANSLGNAMVVGNGTQEVALYGESSSGRGIISGPSGGDIVIDAANNVVIEENNTLRLTFVSGVATFPSGGNEGWRGIWLPADQWFGNGTGCDPDPSTLAVSGSYRRFINCDQTSGGLLNTISPIPMPQQWDGTSTLITRLLWDNASASGNVQVWRTVAKCRGNGTADSDSWGAASSDQTATFNGANAPTWSNESNGVTPNGVCTTDPMTLQLELRQISNGSQETNARFLGAMLYYQVLSDEAR